MTKGIDKLDNNMSVKVSPVSSAFLLNTQTTLPPTEYILDLHLSESAVHQFAFVFSVELLHWSLFRLHQTSPASIGLYFPNVS